MAYTTFYCNENNYSVKTPEGMLDGAPSIDTTELISAVAESKE